MSGYATGGGGGEGEMQGRGKEIEEEECGESIRELVRDIHYLRPGALAPRHIANDGVDAGRPQVRVRGIPVNQLAQTNAALSRVR